MYVTLGLSIVFLFYPFKLLTEFMTKLVEARL